MKVRNSPKNCVTSKKKVKAQNENKNYFVPRFLYLEHPQSKSKKNDHNQCSPDFLKEVTISLSKNKVGETKRKKNWRSWNVSQQFTSANAYSVN